eukprot:gnl/TRDRNA2_/TRDRNA2_187847_c0_seq1.p1 gnl/TRDRNA2_/TRDRNA2_187847_c0~~gnl/TRDRNA2_/TRDRNA2_187847_c0_seq1.p1  ORF type:complete len:243 (-),score=33.28 gnl/TRDRNA2_/TRDRNA2_187847_c0_seq1:65-793(-)
MEPRSFGPSARGGRVDLAVRFSTLRSRGTPTSISSNHVANFFKDWDKDLASERKEIAEEEQAMQQRRRALGIRCRDAKHLGGKLHSGRTSPSGSFPRSSSLPGLSGMHGGDSPKGNALPSEAYSADVLAGADLYLQEWKLHDEAWSRFQEAPPVPLTVDSVPWPPCSDDVLQFCEQLWAPGHPKQAYRIACRRWHPDKFLQLHGSNVQPEDLEGLTTRLNEVFQSVTAQWERLEARRSRRKK